MKTFLTIVMIVCVLAISAASFDVRCAALRPSPNTLVLACSAGRLEPRP